MQASKEEETSSNTTLPGQVALIGLGQPGPEFLSLSAIRLINQADLVVACQQCAGVFDQPEIESLRPEQLQLVAQAAELSQALIDTVAVCETGKQVVWLVNSHTGCPTSCTELFDLVKQLRHRDCRILQIPGATNNRIALHLCGIEPGEVVSLATPAVTPRQLPDGDVSIAGQAEEFSHAVRALANRKPEDPVLVVTKCGTDAQETKKTTLKKLPSLDPGESFVLLSGPSVDTATMWWENRPMHGWRVLVPTTTITVDRLRRRIASYGAVSETVSTLAIEQPKNPAAVDRAVRGFVDGSYQWIVFTSEHAVSAIIERLKHYGLDARSFAGVRVAVTDAEAERALRNWGITPDLVPIERTALGLTAEFPVYDEMLDPLNGVFVPRAEIATEVLNQELTDLGWKVEEVSVYRAVRAAPPAPEIREAIKSGDYDAVVFTSATAVKNMIGIAGKPHDRSLIAAIGQATAQACQEHGLRVDVVAKRPEGIQLVDDLAHFADLRRQKLLDSGKLFLRPSQTRRRRRRKQA